MFLRRQIEMCDRLFNPITEDESLSLQDKINILRKSKEGLVFEDQTHEDFNRKEKLSLINYENQSHD